MAFKRGTLLLTGYRITEFLKRYYRVFWDPLIIFELQIRERYHPTNILVHFETNKKHQTKNLRL